MSDAVATDAEAPLEEATPIRYWVWLTGTTVSLLGSQVLTFALAWSAAGHGGALAGAVSAARILPRTVVLLIGGAIADRIGAWRVMLVSDAAMTAAALVFGFLALAVGAAPVLLILAAVVIGLADAFYVPASGSMPRRLVPDSKLTQAMSARQVGGQLATVLGGPVAGAIMVSAGLAVAGFADAASFAVIFAVLLAIRPAEPKGAPAPDRSRFLGAAIDGLRLCVSEPILRVGLLLLVGTAGFLLPVSTMLMPVLARQHHWSATHLGLVVGAIGAGTALVAMLVMVKGGMSRPGIAGCLGVAIAGIGMLLLATAPATPLSIAAGFIIGAGTGVFSTHVGPVVLGGTPRSHLARVQAVVALSQSLPLILTTAGLGILAQAASARLALAASAAALILVAAGALTSQDLRRTTRPS